jgi:membrane fusion protein, multidrug efflux system
MRFDAKVTGYISEVLVADNQAVKAGQLLARIDDRDFQTALNQARADVAAAEAAVRNLDAQIELQEPVIQQQAAEVDATEANLKFAQEERAIGQDIALDRGLRPRRSACITMFW